MTTPTGKLAYGQPGNYDASDDRAVITAVTGGRIGLVRPVSVAAGTGCDIVIRGGWVGVASCQDLTSAVVGSRDELVVQANPGPGTGSRDDVIWCDTNPDEGTWQLSVMTRAQAVGRSGIPLASIVVPANANVAAQMNITPVDAAIDRRLLSYTTMGAPGGADYTATSWVGAVDRGVTSVPVGSSPASGTGWPITARACRWSAASPPARHQAGRQHRHRGAQRGPGARAQPDAPHRDIRLAVLHRAEHPPPRVHLPAQHRVRSGFGGSSTGGSRKHPQTPGSIRPGGYNASEVGPSTQWLSVEDIGSMTTPQLLRWGQSGKYSAWTTGR